MIFIAIIRCLKTRDPLVSPRLVVPIEDAPSTRLELRQRSIDVTTDARHFDVFAHLPLTQEREFSFSSDVREDDVSVFKPVMPIKFLLQIDERMNIVEAIDIPIPSMIVRRRRKMECRQQGRKHIFWKVRI
jgi:hypothetical protein